MQISAYALLKTHIIDKLVLEPVGGAHRNHYLAAGYLKEALLEHLGELKQLSLTELLERRYNKYRNIGPFVQAASA